MGSVGLPPDAGQRAPGPTVPCAETGVRPTCSAHGSSQPRAGVRDVAGSAPVQLTTAASVGGIARQHRVASHVTPSCYGARGHSGGNQSDRGLPSTWSRGRPFFCRDAHAGHRTATRQGRRASSCRARQFLDGSVDTTLVSTPDTVFPIIHLQQFLSGWTSLPLLENPAIRTWTGRKGHESAGMAGNAYAMRS